METASFIKNIKFQRKKGGSFKWFPTHHKVQTINVTTLLFQFISSEIDYVCIENPCVLYVARYCITLV
jgi:hypothetical protein